MIHTLASIIPFGVDDATLTKTGGFLDLLSTPVGKVYAVLMTFTIVLAFVGLLMAAYKVQMGGDLSGLGTQLVMTVIVSVVVSNNNLPIWVLNGTTMMGEGIYGALGFNPKDVMLDYTKELGLDTADSLPESIVIMAAAGFWGIGVGFIALSIVSVLMICLAWIMCACAWGGIILAYIVQIACIYVGLALAPLFLGMLLFEKTRETGTKYFTGLISIMFWPLGWALGFMVVDAMISPIHDFLFNSTEAIGLQILNAVLSGVICAGMGLMEGGFIVAVILKMPKIIGDAVTSGSQVGAGLISAGVGGGVGAVSGAAAAGGAIVMTAATGGAGAGAAAGGAAGKGGGAAMGSSAT